jgi:hypothetical protein
MYARTNRCYNEPITFVLAYQLSFFLYFFLFGLIQSQYLINTLKTFHGVGVSHNIALFFLSRVFPSSSIIIRTYNYRVFLQISIIFTSFTVFVLPLMFPYYSFTYLLSVSRCLHSCPSFSFSLFLTAMRNVNT